jgi:hypothetical protein
VWRWVLGNLGHSAFGDDIKAKDLITAALNMQSATADIVRPRREQPRRKIAGSWCLFRVPSLAVVNGFPLTELSVRLVMTLLGAW